MNATLDKPVMDFKELENEFSGDLAVIRSRLQDDPSYLQDHFVMIHGTNCAWDKSTNTPPAYFGVFGISKTNACQLKKVWMQ